MSDEMRDSANETSMETPDGVESMDTATPEDALGDAGKRALAALRAENKALKAQIKATESTDEQRDADSAEDSTSDDARDAVTVEPTSQPPRFQGTGDGGAAGRSAVGGGQLTADHLRSMSPAAIEKARRNGQLRNLLSGK